MVWCDLFLPATTLLRYITWFGKWSRKRHSVPFPSPLPCAVSFVARACVVYGYIFSLVCCARMSVYVCACTPGCSLGSPSPCQEELGQSLMLTLFPAQNTVVRVRLRKTARDRLCHHVHRKQSGHWGSTGRGGPVACVPGKPCATLSMPCGLFSLHLFPRMWLAFCQARTRTRAGFKSKRPQEQDAFLWQISARTALLCLEMVTMVTW